MGDGTEAQTLWVTVNGQDMTLNDYLAMNDKALAFVHDANYPDSATVTLTDGTRETWGAYKAQVEYFHSQAYQDANSYLDKVQENMKLSVDTLGKLADHLNSKGDAVLSLLAEMQADPDIANWRHGVGTDPPGLDFANKAGPALQDMYTDMQTLAKGHHNYGRGVSDCHDTAHACMVNTLAAFGR